MQSHLIEESSNRIKLEGSAAPSAGLAYFFCDNKDDRHGHGLINRNRPCRNYSTLRCKRTGNSVVVVASGIEEGNYFYGSRVQGSFSVGDAPVFEALFEGSGGDDEPSVSKPVDQPLMSITVGKV